MICGYYFMILEKNRKKMTLAPMLGKQDLTVTHNHRRFQILPGTCQFLEGHNSVMQPLFKSLKFTRQKKRNLEKTFGCFQKQFFFPPKSSFLIGLSIIFTIHFGGPLLLEKKHLNSETTLLIWCGRLQKVQLLLSRMWKWFGGPGF